MFGNGMYVSIFYCLCYEMDVSTDMSEDQVSEERDMGLNGEEDIRMDEIRDEHWRDVSEEDDYKKNMHALRWYIYIKTRRIL